MLLGYPPVPRNVLAYLCLTQTGLWLPSLTSESLLPGRFAFRLLRSLLHSLNPEEEPLARAGRAPAGSGCQSVDRTHWEGAMVPSCQYLKSVCTCQQLPAGIYGHVSPANGACSEKCHQTTLSLCEPHEHTYTNLHSVGPPQEALKPPDCFTVSGIALLVSTPLLHFLSCSALPL